MELDTGSDDEKPWAMPADYLPIPDGYLSDKAGAKDPEAAEDPRAAAEAGNVDLRNYSHDQLMALAQAYNEMENIHPDPFEAVLHGIPERAQLRPGSKRPICNYMGPEGLGKYSKYGKAWAKLYKGVGILDDDQPAPKRTKAAAAAASKPKPKPRNRTAPKQDFRNWTRQQLLPDLTPEQQRWHTALAGFLGRPIDLPLLAPGAPVLDLRQLFIEVMAQGGQAHVTEAKGWTVFARHMQREPGYGPLVAAVYNCYLHPLEQQLPYGFRAAKAYDLMTTLKKKRDEMGPEMGARLATYDAVEYTADRADDRLQQMLGTEPLQQQQLPPLPPLPPQKQQPAGGRKRSATPPAAAGGRGRASGKQQQQLQLQLPPPAEKQPAGGRKGGATPPATAGGRGRASVEQQQEQQQPQKAQARQHQQQQPQHQGVGLQQQQQQQAQPRIAQLTLQMLHAAAREPDALVVLHRQHKLHSGLHKPSQKACMQDYRRRLTAKLKRGAARAWRRSFRAADRLKEWEENGDEALFGAEITDYSDSEGSGAEADGGGDGGSKQQAPQHAAAAAAQPSGAATAAAAAGAAVGAADATGGGASSGGRGGRSSSSSKGGGTPSSREERGKIQGCGRGPRLSSQDASDDAAAAAEDAAEDSEERQQQQPQQEQLLPPLWKTDRVMHDAACCLLLSRRAVLSGPPGCKKAPLQLLGMLPRVRVLDHRASGSGGGRGRGRGRGAGAGRNRGGAVEKGRKRVYYGRTPRCGKCKTCLNPSMKQACAVNRPKMLAKLKLRGGVQAKGKGKGSISKAVAGKGKSVKGKAKK